MATYIRLTDYRDSDSKEQGFFKPENRYEAKQEDFEKIPGSPIAYWVSDRVKRIFENSQKLSTKSTPRQGMSTTDNMKYLRFWNEINFHNIEFNSNIQRSWFPYNKGGEYRKWYGNFINIVNYTNNGGDLIDLVRNKYPRISDPEFVIKNREYYFKEGITWTDLTSAGVSVRYLPNNFIFDAAGPCGFIFENENLLYVLSFLNTKFVNEVVKLLNPTMHFTLTDYSNIPIIFPKQDSIKQQIDTLTQENIDISKQEWDSRETSWDFAQNEILRILNDEFLSLNEKMPTLETVYDRYCEYWRQKFDKLHANEEE